MTEERKKNRRTTRKVILALGMVRYDSSADARAVDRKTAAGTSNASVRDYYRLRALGRLTGMHVVSMNRDHSAMQRHVQGSFSKRAVREWTSEKNASAIFPHRHARIDVIVLDYFRFPSEYMTKAYVPVIAEFLPALAEASLIDASTAIYVPNADSVRGALERHSSAWSFTRIAAADNPLYRATSVLQKTAKDALGSYDNEQQAAVIVRTGKSEREYPFLAVRMRL